MKIDFNAEKHEYKINGKDVPSVTQVLSLAGEFKNINKEILSKAARFGTAVHKATELYDLGTLNLEKLDPALMPYLEAWKKFLVETNFKVRDIEYMVGTSQGYAGTIDRIGYFNDELTILDIKSGSTLPRTTPLQLSAYAAAYNETHNDWIKQRISVHLKPLKYSIKRYSNIADFTMFLNFLSVYKWSYCYE
jgi:hypothetical protein